MSFLQVHLCSILPVNPCNMIRKNFAAALLTGIILSVTSCGGKNNKPEKEDAVSKEKTETATKGEDDGMVPAIDINNLKDEASITDAMTKVVDARIADEKKRTADPSYKGHFVELMKLHTAVLRASTEYSKTITDPNKALEFSQKINDIEKKLDKNGQIP